MKRSQQIVDELLVMAAQDGDAGALEQLARRHYPAMLRLARRGTEDAESAAEVCQEAWLAILRGIGSLEDPAAFVGWANRIVSRRAADRVRRRVRARGREATGEGAEGAVAVAAGSEHTDLREAIEGLSVDHREVVRLFYGRSMGVGEIAAALGVPAGTVKSRLHHAREALRATLERNGR